VTFKCSSTLQPFTLKSLTVALASMADSLSTMGIHTGMSLSSGPNINPGLRGLELPESNGKEAHKLGLEAKKWSRGQ